MSIFFKSMTMSLNWIRVRLLVKSAVNQDLPSMLMDSSKVKKEKKNAWIENNCVTDKNGLLKIELTID